MDKTSLSVIILVLNEELHIRRCIESVKNIAEQIIIVADDRNSDSSLKIAEEFGAEIYTRRFNGYSDQFNWALDNIKINGDWILRIDADEYLTKELAEEIREKLSKSTGNMTGFFMKRRVIFLGRWIKHGGYYPTWLLRLFKKGCGRSVDVEMDERIEVLSGKTGKLKYDFVDENLNDLSWWTEKHNKYASLEANDILISNDKKGAKKVAYLKLPMFFRAFVYFIYRYYFKLGFLDGREGLIFHFLQGFWYRFLIDSKLYERERKRGV